MKSITVVDTWYWSINKISYIINFVYFVYANVRCLLTYVLVGVRWRWLRRCGQICSACLADSSRLGDGWRRLTEPVGGLWRLTAAAEGPCGTVTVPTPL